MSILEVSEIYNLISKGSQDIKSREQARLLRKAALEYVFSDSGFTKVAFDTRRIDQETEYNPRRGLQNYIRSESFISEAMSQKIENFTKLRKALVGLKQAYGKEPEWLDSNARVLLSTLDKGLRVGINDGDFSEAQPSMGSLAYIEELMYVRYRLGQDDLTKMAETDLQKAILAKDEELVYKDLNRALGASKSEGYEEPQITKRNIATQSYEALAGKVFENVQLPKGNSDSDRSVVININLGK